jgi:mannose/fructose/N-acetylgalactosamine-specific phosphotransferase system component IIC
MIPMMKTMNVRAWISSLVLAFATAACRPVLTIGWGEVGIIIVLIILLLGPVLFNIYKKVGEFREWNQKKTREDDQK